MAIRVRIRLPTIVRFTRHLEKAFSIRRRKRHDSEITHELPARGSECRKTCGFPAPTRASLVGGSLSVTAIFPEFLEEFATATVIVESHSGRARVSRAPLASGRLAFRHGILWNVDSSRATIACRNWLGARSWYLESPQEEAVVTFITAGSRDVDASANTSSRGTTSC
jgi:hypothetical protein